MIPSLSWTTWFTCSSKYNLVLDGTLAEAFKNFVGKNKKGMAQQELVKESHDPSSTTTKTKKADELRDPTAIQPMYSMRSVKTSKGM